MARPSAPAVTWSQELTGAARADPSATPRAVRRIVGRALRGGRLDDVVRGRTTLSTGMWILSQLVRGGLVRLDEDGTVRSVSAPSTAQKGQTAYRAVAPATGGLVDPTLADDLIDWDAMAAILENRPYEPSSEFFQSFDTFDTLRRRLAVMEHHGDLTGRTVLQLGDDEMFAVALALTEGVHHVHVADADGRVLAAIAREAGERGLPLTTHQVDVRTSTVPVTGVDTFFVSGLKDAGGLLLFIVCALATTSAGATGYIGYDPDVYRRGLSEQQVHHDVLQTLHKLDCTVTAMLACDELAFSPAFRARLASVVREAADDGIPASVLSERLRELADAPGVDLYAAKEGFPDIPLLPAPLVRVETGDRTAATARRYLRFLQSAAAR